MPSLTPAEISQIAAQVADEISSLMKGEMASKVMAKKMPPSPPGENEDPAVDSPEDDSDAMDAMAADMPMDDMQGDEEDPLKKKALPFGKR